MGRSFDCARTPRHAGWSDQAMLEADLVGSVAVFGWGARGAELAQGIAVVFELTPGALGYEWIPLDFWVRVRTR